MLFCPTCANGLVISSETGYNKWACNTCAYEFPISKQMTSRTKLKLKEVDDVLGGDEMWKHADSTAAQCDKCNHDQAYFYQLQIRSADEPMTTFYRCASCGFRWREN
jgi:DNA-directed RNA polymerase III subunit RPC11